MSSAEFVGFERHVAGLRCEPVTERLAVVVLNARGQGPHLAIETHALRMSILFVVAARATDTEP